MQLALSKQGKWIYAWNAERGHYYQCPECMNTVVCCHGQHKQPYFAHLNGNHEHGGPETQEHILGKKQIWEWLSCKDWSVQMEQYLPQIQQRPDIMAKRKQQQFIIEFQCSPISVKRLVLRNNGYRQMGIPFYWYLGSPYQIKLQRVKQAQFTQLINGKPALLYWDVKRQTPVYKFMNENVLVKKRRFNSYSLAKLSRYYPKLAELAYKHHYLLAGCPWLVHRQDPDLKLADVDEFSWRLRLCLKLETIPLGTLHEYVEWEQWFYRQTNWLAMPCVELKTVHYWRRHRIALFFRELSIEGCFQPVGNFYALVAYPHWFDDPALKLASFPHND